MRTHLVFLGISKQFCDSVFYICWRGTRKTVVLPALKILVLVLWLLLKQVVKICRHFCNNKKSLACSLMLENKMFQLVCAKLIALIKGLVPEMLFCAMDLILVLASMLFMKKSEQTTVMHFVGIIVVQSNSCISILPVLLTHQSLNVFRSLTFAVHRNTQPAVTFQLLMSIKLARSDYNGEFQFKM